MLPQTPFGGSWDVINVNGNKASSSTPCGCASERLISGKNESASGCLALEEKKSASSG